MNTFATKHHYKSPLDRIVGFYHDAKKTQEKLSALGARNVRVDQRPSPSKDLELVIKRELPAKPPKAIERFFHPWNEVQQREQWTWVTDHKLLCSVNIKIKGIPCTIESRLDFEDTADGCVNHIETKVQSKVPVLGRFIEEFIVKDAKRYMDEEYQFIQAHLADA